MMDEGGEMWCASERCGVRVRDEGGGMREES